MAKPTTTTGGSLSRLAVNAADFLLLAFYLAMAVAIPVVYLPIVLPGAGTAFPPAMVDLKRWYVREFGDYLVQTTPGFFVGLAWAKVVFLWPVCLVASFAVCFGARRPAWYRTACLVAGVFVATSLVAMMGETMGTSAGKVSSKLFYQIYVPLMVFSVVATQRGLVGGVFSDEKHTTHGVKARYFARKKKA